MARIQNIQLLSLYVGGRDGGVIKAGAAAVTGAVIHLIEVLEEGATFSVLTAEDQDGSARNMLTANGYASVALSKGFLVFAPFGGKITDYTCDKKTRYLRMSATSREQND